MNSLNKNVNGSQKISRTGYGSILHILLSITYFIVFVHRLTIPSLSIFIKEQYSNNDYTVSDVDITTGNSIYFWCYGLIQPIVGVISVFSRIVLPIALFLMAIGSILIGYCRNIYVLFVSSAIVGIGAGSCYLTIASSLSVWWPKKTFPLITGLLMFVGYAGGFVSSNLVLGSMGRSMGLNNTYLVFAIIAAVTGLLFAILARDSPIELGYSDPNKEEKEEEKQDNPSKKYQKKNEEEGITEYKNEEENNKINKITITNNTVKEDKANLMKEEIIISKTSKEMENEETKLSEPISTPTATSYCQINNEAILNENLHLHLYPEADNNNNTNKDNNNNNKPQKESIIVATTIISEENTNIKEENQANKEKRKKRKNIFKYQYGAAFSKTIYIKHIFLVGFSQAFLMAAYFCNSGAIGNHIVNEFHTDLVTFHKDIIHSTLTMTPVIGCLIMASISNHLGRVITESLCGFILMIVYICQCIMCIEGNSNLICFVLCNALIGLFVGISVSSGYTHQKEMFTPDIAGAGLGIHNTLQYVIAGLYNNIVLPIVSLGKTRKEGMMYVYILFALSNFMSLLLVSLSTETRVGSIGYKYQKKKELKSQQKKQL